MLFDATQAAENRRGRIAVVGDLVDTMGRIDSAYKLKAGDQPQHPAIKIFKSWTELNDHVELDFELKYITRYVEHYGDRVPWVLQALRRECLNAPGGADLVYSTAHKAKGLEWDQVVIGDDFVDVFKPSEQGSGKPSRKPTDEEFNLLYVAVTRARKRLEVPPELDAILGGGG